MKPIQNVTVIENPVSSVIQIAEKNLFCERVSSLDELTEVEDVLQTRGIDYAIAEFDYRTEEEGSRRRKWERVFSIFVNLRHGRIKAPAHFAVPLDEENVELCNHFLHDTNFEKQRLKSEDFGDY